MPTQTRSPRWLFPLIIITIMMTLVIFASRRERADPLSRQQTEQERLKAEIEKEERNRAALPRADYAEPPSADPTPKQIRKARDKQYESIIPFDRLNKDVVELPRVVDEPFEMRGLPIDRSDLVVMGTITNTKGYVKENRSSAYSEYAVKITEVFRGTAKLAGSEIIAERFGATVVFPNGRILKVYDANYGTLEIEHRYVLFLKYSPEGQDYNIVTAYDLLNGKVMSIDRWPQCEFFDGNDEAAFLDLVRSSVK